MRKRPTGRALPAILPRVNALGARVKALRQERGLLQKQVAEKAGLTASMVSQIESGRLNPTLTTLRKVADAFGISIPELLEPPAGARTVYISRKQEHPLVSFEDCAERWMVLGAGLFDGKIRAVVSTLGGRARGVSTDKVRIKPGQMKLFYVLEGKVALRYVDKAYRMTEGDSALVDGAAPHGWDNLGRRRARVLWVILG
jgi:transcriptional regulator with XRE-family HTH domain